MQQLIDLCIWALVFLFVFFGTMFLCGVAVIIGSAFWAVADEWFNANKD